MNIKKENKISLIDAPSRAQRILNKNDILFQTVRPYQKNNLFFKKEGNYVASTGYAQIRNEKSSEYLFYFLHTDNFVNKVLLRCTGTSYPAINSSDLGDIKISFPSLPEQQKIAFFLSSVDEKIEKVKEKKKNLEEYKKGVMQKIFSVGNEYFRSDNGNKTKNNGNENVNKNRNENIHSLQNQIRFKDENGEDFGEWEEKKLGEIATFSKGKGLSKDDIIEKGKNKCIHYGELFTKYGPKIKNILSNTNLGGNLVFSEGNETLMPTSDVTPNGLATGSALSEKNVILGGDILIIKGEKLYNLFFSYYISSHKQDVMKLVSGSTVYHLYGSDMKKLKINLPNIKEQEKIADFLSGIDEKIENVSYELEKMEEFKKGLLQGMFV